jgi:hypothetical protein
LLFEIRPRALVRRERIGREMFSRIGRGPTIPSPGQVGHAPIQGLPGVGGPVRLPVQQDLAASHRLESEQPSRQGILPAALEAGQPDDLPLRQRQGHVGIRVRPAQIAHFQDRLGTRGGRGVAEALHLGPADGADEVLRRQFRHGVVPDVLAIPHHGHVLAQIEDLLEVVRDVHEGDASLPLAAHEAEEELDVALG